jgi:hypothetical protein
MAFSQDIDALLKKSDTRPLPVVFTAFSKTHFYCGDALCEFVFGRGGAPLNPFKAYGYFLNDRVDRDLVRRANNTLIQHSDALWVFGPISDGVLFEIFLALDRGMPVRFFTIATRASEIEEIGGPEALVFEEDAAPPERVEEVRGLLARVWGT